MASIFSKYRQILQDFSYMYVVVFIQKVLALATTYFLVRVLSENQFAEYTIVISYLSLFAAFSLPEIGNAVMQSAARNSSGVYIKAQRVMFLGTIIAGLLLLGVAVVHKFLGDHSSSLFWAIVLIAVLFPFYRGLTIWKSYLLGLKKFKNLSFLNSASHIVTHASMIFVLFNFDTSSYILLILLYILVPSALNIGMSIFDRKVCTKDKDVPLEEGIMDYGLKTSFYSALHALAFRLDHFVIFYFISPEVFALFAVANRIPELLRGVTQTLAAVLAPRFATASFITSDVKKSIHWFSISYGLLIIVMAFTIYPYFMDFMFGEKYADAILYSQVIMCSLIIGNVANLNFRYIRSQKDTHSYKLVMLTISFTRILTVIILVPLFGIWGAIASMFVYRLSLLLIVNYIIKTKYSSPKQLERGSK